MAESPDGVFTIPENAQLYVMEASDNKITADSILNNSVIQLAITLSNELEDISTCEMNDVYDMTQGTYTGWMATGGCPGLYNGDSDDISITTTLINEAQSVYGAQTSTAQSSESNLTGHVKMIQQRIQAVEQFMSQVVGEMDYLASLLAQPL